MATIKESLQNFKGLIQVSPQEEQKEWHCRQCSQVEETEAEFAKHLRSHLAGHRGRIRRKPAKSKDAPGSKHDKLSANSAFIKFDSLTSSQFEISQPNTVTNLMHINYQNREMCEQLVDPSLVMPSKHTENSMECSEFNYTEILNFSNIPSGVGVTIDDGQNANNLIMELNSFSNEKDVNLKILANAVANNSDSGQQMNIQNSNDENLGTITPLNLYYIEGGHFASTVQNVEISELDEVISADQNNMVIVDNSIDKTVRLIDLNGQIISGSPFEINTLDVNAIEAPNKAAMFVCEICKKEFTTQAYLYRHLRKHTGEFSCNYCNSVFARKETCITHCCAEQKAAIALQLSQLPETDHKMVPDSTTIPPNELTTKDDSKEVQAKKPPPVKKSTEKKSLSCPACNLSLSDNSCLKRHMLTHEKTLCYTCVYCGTAVAHRHSIRRHLKLQHPEYEHEWNDTDFITSLQTEVRKRSVDNTGSDKSQNAKKKKFNCKTGKDSANIKLPTHCPKKDSLLGTTMVDDKLDFDCHLLKNNTSQSREYLNIEKSQSITSVKDDSLDLSSFTAHFDEDIGHISFQALALPEILCKGGEIVKLDSKENSPMKNFNIGSLLLFNPSSTKRNSEFLPEITFGEQLSNSNLNKTDSKFKKDTNVFCSTSFLSANERSPEKIIRLGNCLKTDTDDGISEIFVSPLKGSNGLGGIVQMPSMPVLLCEEEKMEALAKVDDFNAGMEILLCQSLEAVPPQSSLDQQRPHRTPHLLQQEEPNPSCSAGYVLEENSAMRLVDTSNDFTFYVLG